ncbi:heavy-metal-associated domain protein [Kordia sp. SMS9]|uniref:heavy-metal-associated domain-containing protein n=1 Tax=Kordia sp. SMS9 TaxID=2282170 RepID=UPI000E0D609B|nr:heavy-metal-associated domain-containing protein [Kordia sp. SMS9]AXG70798.1 heavy-metal-associated domain protein [Kordia sp. SMS9]
MKKGILLVAMIAGLAIVGCKGDAKAETKEETKTITKNSKGKELSMATFGVRGNCGMCKETIEKAAHSVKGVAKATWDVKKKSIEISYDEYVVNENVVHKAIAAAGYDTDKMEGDKEAYSNLPKCCQYSDEQLMNQE